MTTYLNSYKLKGIFKMNVLRFTVIDDAGVVSFVAPWNALKALTAGCSTKPAPETLITLLEAASKYDTGLKKYVLDNLAIFDENHAKLDPTAETLNPLLEKQLNELLANTYQTTRSNPAYKSAFGEVETEAGETNANNDNIAVNSEDTSRSETETDAEEETEITYEELARIQRVIAARAESYHPVFRVTDAETRRRSQEPAGAGLIIFNLTAKRIIQVQNSLAPLQRSDRGRYHENGHPTERLYFYRLPADWSIVP